MNRASFGSLMRGGPSKRKKIKKREVTMKKKKGKKKGY